MSITQSTPTSTDSASDKSVTPVVCNEADRAAGRCSAEASDAGKQTPKVSTKLDSTHCKDLPNCTITSSASSQVEALVGKIGKEMTITQLITNGVLQGSETASGQVDATKARNRATDKVTSLVVEPTQDGKTTTQADFLVKADGTVVAVNNLDNNKNNTVRIAFEPVKDGNVKSEHIAIDVLTQYIKAGYGDQAKFQITDNNNMVAAYLKSPDVEPGQNTMAGSHYMPGGYGPRNNYGGLQANPWINRGNQGPFAPAETIRSEIAARNQLGSPGIDWNGNLFDTPTYAPTIDPFEATICSVLGWLEGYGINLGNPPDPAILATAIKKLEKENPQLAKELGSKEFKDLIQNWHDTGRVPTSQELAKALPQNVLHNISHELIEKYAAEFKDAKGQVDWSKVAVSVHVGHEATAQDIADNRDIAFAAVAHTSGECLPQGERLRVIEQGLQLCGAPCTMENIMGMNQIISRESSWRPNAINTWDTNAMRGTPSMGLAQVIPPTFQAYAPPGCNDIYNPAQNIAAAANYMGHRYGGGNSGDNISAGIAYVASRPGGY